MVLLLKGTEKSINCFSTPISPIDKKRACHKQFGLQHDFVSKLCSKTLCWNQILKIAFKSFLHLNSICKVLYFSGFLWFVKKPEITFLFPGMDFHILYCIETYVLMFGIIFSVTQRHSYYHPKIHVMSF